MYIITCDSVDRWILHYLRDRKQHHECKKYSVKKLTCRLLLDLISYSMFLVLCVNVVVLEIVDSMVLLSNPIKLVCNLSFSFYGYESFSPIRLIHFSPRHSYSKAYCTLLDDESLTSNNLGNDHGFIIEECSLHWYEAFWGSPKQSYESLCSKWTISYYYGESVHLTHPSGLLEVLSAFSQLNIHHFGPHNKSIRDLHRRTECPHQMSSSRVDLTGTNQAILLATSWPR